VETIWQDLRYGARMFLKNPGFTSIAVFTLALGIGANTALFSFTDAVLFRPLPFAEPERLVMVKGAPGTLVDMGLANPEKFMQWNHPVQSLEYVAVYDSARANLADYLTPERIQVMRVSAGFFPMLGVNPLHGRWFSNEEFGRGRNRVLILSYRLWRRHYVAAADILEKSVRLNGPSFNIIGVMPPEFQFLHDLERADAWMPLLPDDHILGESDFELSGRLKPGVTLATAQAELNLLNEQLELDERRIGRNFVSDMRLRLAPFNEKFASGLRRPLLILLAAVAFVLLLACANVANLMLTRSVGRSKELAIRSALGAGRWRLARLWLIESLLLSGTGGVLGLLVSNWLLDALVAISRQDVTPVNQISLNWRVIAFCSTVTLLTGLLFGIAPALQSSKPDLARTLKESGQRSATGLSPRLRRVLTVSEIAIALVLLIGAGLMVKSFRSILQVAPGFNPEHVVTFELAPTAMKYETKEKRAALYQTIIERLRAIPGVASAGAITSLPIARGSVSGLPIKVEGSSGSGEPEIGGYQSVTADYFRAMDIPLIAGRYFTEGDRAGTANVMLLNQTLARQVFPNENPVGKRIVLDLEKPTLFEVIGVVGDVRTAGLDEAAFEEFYLHSPQYPPASASFAIRTTVAPASLANAARKAVLEVDREQPLYRVKTMEEVLADSVTDRRFPMLILTAFAATALLLSTLGVYGVVSYTVTQRTHEIGIRVALGAQSLHVLRMVIGQGMKLVMFGIAIGLVAAFALTRLMRAMLFGVSATDPLTFTVIALLLSAAALLACWIPARRATKADPLQALRHE
jgi:putative ABC transport system permease protein